MMGEQALRQFVAADGWAATGPSIARALRQGEVNAQLNEAPGFIAFRLVRGDR